MLTGTLPTEIGLLAGLSELLSVFCVAPFVTITSMRSTDEKLCFAL